MSVKPGQTLYLTAVVTDPLDGTPMNADSLPTGVLYHKLVALGTAVTVTNLAIGRYGFQVTIPSDWVAGDGGSLIAEAVLDGTTYYASVDFVADTKRVSDLQDITAANVRTQADAALTAYDAPTNTEMIARTLPTADYATSTALAAVALAVGAVNTIVSAIALILTGITSLANWLRALARSDTADSTAKTEIAGTYNEATDSLQAIRDRGDAAWVTGEAAQGGSYTITTTVIDDDGEPIQGATVKVYSGGLLVDKAETNALGVALPTADAGTYTVVVSKPGLYVSHTEEDFVVDGAESLNVTLSVIVVSMPSSADTTTGYILCIGNDGEPESGVVVTAQMLHGANRSGYSHDNANITMTSGDGGLCQHTGFIRGARYRFKRGTGAWTAAQVAPDADSWAIDEIIGTP